MPKTISILVDDDVYEKFKTAFILAKDEETEAFKHSMLLYIIEIFEKTLESYRHDYRPRTSAASPREVYGKAKRLIPKWAREPMQKNHKIIRSFFAAEQATGQAPLAEMERLCSDQTNMKLYVPTFKSNYAQMKLDAPKSHGRVFEDDGETVHIWAEVKDALYRYKNFFTN